MNFVSCFLERTDECVKDGFRCQVRDVLHRHQLRLQLHYQPAEFAEQSPFIMLGAVGPAAKLRERPARSAASKKTGSAARVQLCQLRPRVILDILLYDLGS